MTISVMMGVIVMIAASAFADENEFGKVEDVKDVKEKNYVIAPMVISNPNLGSGGGLTALYFYSPDPDDQVSPPSTVGGVGIYTNTDTYFIALFNKNHFQEDTWRFSTGIVNGRIKNELNIPALGEVRFTTRVKGIGTQLQRRIWGDFFAGVKLAYSGVSYKEGNEASKDYFEHYGVEDQDTGSWSILMSYDSRDDQRYPYKGVLAEAGFTANPEWLGASEGYYVVEGSANSFHQLIPDHVLALRVYGRFTPSDTPYAGLSSLGRRSDLRGYVSGEIVAENMISTQAEYRWFFTRKWGIVGFGGVATLYDGNVTNINSDIIYYSGGVGLRYLLHAENRVNFRVDYAWGEDGEKGFYVSISEAF